VLLVHERRRSRRLPSAIRAERAQRVEQSNMVVTETIDADKTALVFEHG
jgi:hypothetical protein